MTMDIEKDVKEALKFAESNFPEYNSYHEGFGIIAEEFDELWDEIKEKDHNRLKLYKEASHVACTAIRFMKLVKRKYETK